MANQLLHTPEGVRDIYEEECKRKLTIQQQIQKVFCLYGYQNIETPTFEFFDIFNKDRGSVADSEMFKFFDRDNQTLVLRPDITPSIARCVAKYYMEETMSLRLCYLERTFTNNSSYQGRLKEVTQTGAELIGDDSSAADAEMIAMVIDSLRAVGLQEFQVELGQMDFFRGLLEEAGMDLDTEERLRELIEQKNFFGVEELLTEQSMSQELKEVFLKLPELFGSLEQIRLARTLTSNVKAIQAIDRLEKVQAILETYGLADYVSYDLGMLSKYQYYTGIIFKAYTYGTGTHIVTGGRYDKLLVQFGKDAPAVGFAIMVDQLMMALSRQQISTSAETLNTMVLYHPDAQVRAVKLANHLRRNGMALSLTRKSSKKTMDEYLSYANRFHIRNILYLDSSGLEIQAYCAPDGSCDVIPYSEYVKEEA